MSDIDPSPSLAMCLGASPTDENLRRVRSFFLQSGWYGARTQASILITSGGSRMTIFCTPLDLAQSSMGQAHTVGDGTLIVVDATPFGSASPTNPVRVTATRAADGARADYLITGIVNDTMTIVAADGYADINLAPDDIVGAYVTAGTLADIHAAILALEVLATTLAPVNANAAWHPPSLADTVALAGSIYYSTTAGKLVFKDAGGTVRPITS